MNALIQERRVLNPYSPKPIINAREEGRRYAHVLQHVSELLPATPRTLFHEYTANHIKSSVTSTHLSFFRCGLLGCSLLRRRLLRCSRGLLLAHSAGLGLLEDCGNVLHSRCLFVVSIAYRVDARSDLRERLSWVPWLWAPS